MATTDKSKEGRIKKERGKRAFPHRPEKFRRERERERRRKRREGARENIEKENPRFSSVIKIILDCEESHKFSDWLY